MITISEPPKGVNRHAAAVIKKAWVLAEVARFTKLCDGKIIPSYIKSALLKRNAQVLFVDANAAAILLPGRSNEEVYIELICAKRGGGHGRQLFEAIKERAISMGKTSITLRAATHSLISVYNRWGFVRSDAPCGSTHPWWQLSALDTKSGYFMTMCLKEEQVKPTVAQRFWDMAIGLSP